MELRELLGWLFFEILLDKDSFDMVIESNVVDQVLVKGLGKGRDEGVVFLVCECDFLREERSLEFHERHVPLSENVVVLEELQKSDSILLHNDLDFVHQRVQIFLACEFPEFGRISFPGSGRLVLILWSGFVEELEVFDVSLGVPIDRFDGVELAV